MACAKYEKALRYTREYTEVQEGDPKELGETLAGLRFTLNNNTALVCMKVWGITKSRSRLPPAMEAPNMNQDHTAPKSVIRASLSHKMP